MSLDPGVIFNPNRTDVPFSDWPLEHLEGGRRMLVRLATHLAGGMDPEDKEPKVYPKLDFWAAEAFAKGMAGSADGQSAAWRAICFACKDAGYDGPFTALDASADMEAIVAGAEAMLEAEIERRKE